MKINYKKFQTIISINILIVVFLITCANIYIQNNIYNGKIKYFADKYSHFIFDEKQNNETDIEKRINYLIEEKTVKEIELTKKSLEQFCGEKRLKFGTNYSSNPILIFGCSYSYGHGLKKEESFPYILSNTTKRPVYNFNNCGEELLIGFRNLLDFTEEENNKKIIQDTEYFVYVYMFDHINRYLNIEGLYCFYELLFGKPNNKIQKILLNIPLYRLICSSLKLREILSEYPKTEKIEEFLKLTILNSYNEIKKYTPNAKMIIILYEEKIPNNYSKNQIFYFAKFINSKIWQELETETNGDIQIVRTKDIMGFYFDKNYKLEKDIANWHPNARAWKEFTPKFASKYIK